MGIRIEPLSYVLGARVHGADLSRPLPAGDFAAIHRAFLEHGGLLLFRGQQIGREQHIAFSRRFGELDRHDAVPLDRHPEHHEVLIVANQQVVENQNNDKYVGQQWHSDMASTLRPALGSLLRAIEVPPVGGDTMFSNMTLAHDTLSQEMQRLLAGLSGIYRRDRKDLQGEWEAAYRDINPAVAQPAVRVHPETGRKALYVSENTKQFEGMTVAESRPLLDFLVRHATRPQFTYRHQWQPHDLLMWDNRCTMHLALGDFDPRHRRHLERTTVMGTPSGHLAQEAAASAQAAPMARVAEPA